MTLIGTGSEVALAVQAAKALEGEGIRAAVVSMPCFELFEAQSESYRNAVLGSAPRVGVEAAVGVRLVDNGWGRTAPLSACADSALRRRRKTYISISASRRRRSRPPRVI